MPQSPPKSLIGTSAQTTTLPGKVGWRACIASRAPERQKGDGSIGGPANPGSPSLSLNGAFTQAAPQPEAKTVGWRAYMRGLPGYTGASAHQKGSVSFKGPSNADRGVLKNDRGPAPTKQWPPKTPQSLATCPLGAENTTMVVDHSIIRLTNTGLGPPHTLKKCLTEKAGHQKGAIGTKGHPNSDLLAYTLNRDLTHAVPPIETRTGGWRACVQELQVPPKATEHQARAVGVKGSSNSDPGILEPDQESFTTDLWVPKFAKSVVPSFLATSKPALPEHYITSSTKRKHGASYSVNKFSNTALMSPYVVCVAGRSPRDPEKGYPEPVPGNRSTIHKAFDSKADPCKSEGSTSNNEQFSDNAAGCSSNAQQMCSSKDDPSKKLPDVCTSEGISCADACPNVAPRKWDDDPLTHCTTPEDNAAAWSYNASSSTTANPPCNLNTSNKHSAQSSEADGDIESYIERIKSEVKALMPSMNCQPLSRNRRQSGSSQSSSSSTSSKSSNSRRSPYSSTSFKRSVKRQQSCVSSCAVKESSMLPLPSPCRIQRSQASSPSRSRSQSPPVSGSGNHFSLNGANQLPCSSWRRSRSPLKKPNQSPHPSTSKKDIFEPKARRSRSSSRSRNRSYHKRVNRSPSSSKSSSQSSRESSRSSSRSSSSRSRSSSSCSSRYRSSSDQTRATRSLRSRSRSRHRSDSLRHRSLSPHRKGQSSSRSTRSPTSHSGSPAHLEGKHSKEVTKKFGVKVDISRIDFDDKCIKDNIFRLFAPHGMVTSVDIFRTNTERWAVIFFSRSYEQLNAVSAPSKVLFNNKLQISLWTEKDSDTCQQVGTVIGMQKMSRWTNVKVEAKLINPMWNNQTIQYHPRSSRTLLISNLHKAIAPDKLDNICARFENILDIDLENPPGQDTCSALVEFSDITSLVNAAKALDVDFFGTHGVKVDFGDSKESNCLWIDGLSQSMTLIDLMMIFSSYGIVAKTLHDPVLGRALVLYKNRTNAVFAVANIKQKQASMFKDLVMVDFASDNCQLAFCRAMENSGQDIGNFLCE